MAGKGYGRGIPVNYNVSGLPNSSIDKLPDAGVAVFHDEADKALDFCEKLRIAMEGYESGECKFENIDVSQVEWPATSFTVLLDLLISKGVSTKRLKAFKCGLDDDAIRLMAGWLEQLPAESLPREIHLSNNQITMDGLENLLEIIETKRNELATSIQSVWLRVENNQVDGKAIEDLVAAGRVCLVPRCNSPEHQQSLKAAVAMPSFSPTPKQHQAPAIYTGGSAGYRGDKGGRSSVIGGNPWDKGKASGDGKPWDKDKHMWQKDSSSGDKNNASWDKGSWNNNKNDWWSKNSTSDKSSASWDKGTWNSTKNDWWSKSNSDNGKVWSSASTGRVTGAATPVVAQKVIGQMPVVQMPVVQKPVAQKPGSYKVTAAPVVVERPDRSRTPPVRAPALRKDDVLPEPWSKEWSEEYKIPYYWNKVTGDALWEPPKLK